MDEREMYHLLAQAPVDEEELARVEQMCQDDDLAKARLKKRLKKTLFGRRRAKRRRAVTAACAAAVLLVGATAYIGITNPAYAAELLIVGDIFRFLDDGRTGAYDLYQENASEINVTKEDEGIAVTIREAVFDGQSVYYTYELSADKALGAISEVGRGVNFAVKDYHSGFRGSESISAVADGKYVGEASYTLDEPRESIDCRINLREIHTESGAAIKGKWLFALHLDAVALERQTVAQSVSGEGFAVSVDALEKTPMSFSINYTQTMPEAYRGEGCSMNATAEVEAKDDLGNVYLGESQGGQGNANDGVIAWRTTFGKLDERASTLIITPSIYFSAGSGGGVAIDAAGDETPLASSSVKGEPRRLYLEDVVIDLEQ